jgi:HAD superfamily hydrolase (TIGR01484 family)
MFVPKQDVPLSPLSTTLQRLRAACSLVFDVDGTLVERQQFLSADLSRALVGSGKQLGIATSRAKDELDEIFSFSTIPRSELFRGPVILEDGAVIIRDGTSHTIANPDNIRAIDDLRAHLNAHITPVSENNMWGQLAHIEAPLVHIPSRYDYQASLSVWQLPSGNGDDSHLFARIMSWCQNAVSVLQLQSMVELVEIGDGTLRASVPGRSKGVALRELHESHALDLGSTVFFGDGRNDVAAAQVVKDAGGWVVAVDHKCQALVDEAHFVTSLPTPLNGLGTTGPRAIERLLTLAATAESNIQ